MKGPICRLGDLGRLSALTCKGLRENKAGRGRRGNVQGGIGLPRPRWVPHVSLLMSCTLSSHPVFGGRLRHSRTTSQGNTGGHLTSPGPGFPSGDCIALFSLPICGCQDDLSQGRHGREKLLVRTAGEPRGSGLEQVTKTTALGQRGPSGSGPGHSGYGPTRAILRTGAHEQASWLSGVSPAASS